jgi:Mn2+/Fe2+ NRAMP family transporter
VNAVVLPLHAITLVVLASDPNLMGDARIGPWSRAAGWASVALVLACVGALASSWIG